MASGILALLAFFAFQCLDLGRRTSPTFDEPGHLGAGVSYWANGDFRLTTGNLFLAQRFAGVAPWLAGYEFPSKARQLELRRSQDAVGGEFLFRMGHDPVAVLARARAMTTGLGLALGIVVFGLTRRIFGDASALFALGFFATCPPLVTNASLVTTDIATSLWFTLAVVSYWRLLMAPAWHRGAVAGLTLGLLLLTKFSAIGFAAVASCLVVWALWRGARPFPWKRHIGAHLVVVVFGWLTIWMFFGLDPRPGDYEYPWAEIGPGTLVYRVIDFCRQYHLLPDPFLFDCGGLRQLVSKRYSFFAGEHYYGGSFLYFPAAVLFKTQPAMLAALIVAATASVLAWRKHRLSGETADRPGWASSALAPIWALALVFFGLCVASRVNIGHRHLLPIYPALCVLAGGGAGWLLQRNGAARIAAFGLALASVAEAAWFHGRQMAYFSPLGGGPRQGYQWFIDSTIDWGANLPELAEWQRPIIAQEADARFFVGHLGVEEIGAYGVRGLLLSPRTDPADLRGGYYVLSATALVMGYVWRPGPYTMTQETEYQSLRAGPNAPAPARRALAFARLSAFCRRRAPDARIGDVYFVFRLSDAEVQAAFEGPLPAGLPEPPQHSR